ncbi:EamA family transporter [Paenibacillus beijingensis]|uniref:EamA family transporter n=1 Tax=Paenibacillus beijingensis TaxID=1126833 RepID=UPI000697A257|nr:EamA family transporter [Paenibacillus beijingensis]
MWLFITAASALIFGFGGWFMKVSQMRGSSVDAMLLGLYCSGSLGFVIQTVADGSLPLAADWRYWVAGLIIGAGSLWGNAAFMQALRYGPASLTSPVTNLNIVLIIAVSTVFYGETISPAEGTGILLLLAAVVLISVRRKEKLTIKEKKWFLYAGAAVILFTFRNGGLKVTQELDMPGAPVLMIGYVLSFFWFAVAVWRENGNKLWPQDKPAQSARPEAAERTSGAAANPVLGAAAQEEAAAQTAAARSESELRPVGDAQAVSETRFTRDEQAVPAARFTRDAQAVPATRLTLDAPADRFRTGLLLGLLVGLFSYGGLQIYSVALEMGKANLTAPIFATNSLVVAAGSIIVYRERLTRLQWAAFFCLLAGIVVIKL